MGNEALATPGTVLRGLRDASLQRDKTNILDKIETIILEIAPDISLEERKSMASESFESWERALVSLPGSSTVVSDEEMDALKERIKKSWGSFIADEYPKLPADKSAFLAAELTNIFWDHSSEELEQQPEFFEAEGVRLQTILELPHLSQLTEFRS